MLFTNTLPFGLASRSLAARRRWHCLAPQAAAEKMNKILQQQINEVTSKLDEANRTLNDFDASKKKLTIENSEYSRQVSAAQRQDAYITGKTSR